MKKKLFFAIFISLSMLSFSQQICLTNQESELIRLINAERHNRGLTECNISSTLMLAANKNCEEINNETYISHKPSEFGEISGEFAQIRYGTSETDPSRIIKSLTFKSTYTDYSSILLNEDKYASYNWKSIGIAIRKNMIVIFMGEQEPNLFETSLCDGEPYFYFDPTSMYPTLRTEFPEDAIMHIYSVNEFGELNEYIINTLSSFQDKNTGLSLPLNEKNIAEYRFYITPQKSPIVPQEPVYFSIKSSEKGDVYKTIVFKGNSIQEIEAYLGTGVDINFVSDKDPNGYCMLHRAVMLDNLEAVKFLMNKGADINFLSYDNDNAIGFARSPEMFNYLMTFNPELHVANSDKITLLHSYARIGLLDPIKFLVEEKNFDVNAQDRNGGTPITYAIQYNHYNVVKYLLENGAKQIYGWMVYPIHDAVDSGNLDIVKLLIEYGADVNAKDGSGNTPLYHAKIHSDQNAAIINYLISLGAQ